MSVRALRPVRPGDAPGGLLTLAEAAAYLQIAPGTLKHWIAWKRIEHVKISTQVTRFTRAALDRFIQQQTVAAVED